MFKRYWQLLCLILIRDGFKRAKYCKKIGYFHSQGANCMFQNFNFGVEPHLISFGNNVQVAAGVRFNNHDVFGDLLAIKNNVGYGIRRVGKIIIGNNVLLSTNCMIMYDVHIGDNVVVAAGSVVTKDVPSGVIVAGVPARVVGNFEDYEKKILSLTRDYPWLHKNYSIYDEKLKREQEEYFWRAN